MKRHPNSTQLQLQIDDSVINQSLSADALASPSDQPTKRKCVAFRHVCQVIPSCNRKSLRKLIKLYTQQSKCLLKLDKAQDPSASSKPSFLPLPRCEFKKIQLPLLPSSWRTAGLRSSLAKWDISNIDLCAVAGGVGSAFGPCNSNSSSPRQRRNSSSSSSSEARSEIPNNTQRPLRKRGASLSEYSQSPTRNAYDVLSKRVSLYLNLSNPGDMSDGDEIDSASEDDQPCSSSPPRAVRKCIKMSLPTLTGWKRGSSSSIHALKPRKSCLLRSSSSLQEAIREEEATSLSAASQQDQVQPVSRRRKPDQGPPVLISLPQPLLRHNSPSQSNIQPAATKVSPFRLSRKDVTPDKELTHVKLGDSQHLTPLSEPGESTFHERAFSEDSTTLPTSSSLNLADPLVRQKLKAGTWPFQEPLNTECCCSNCEERILLGLSDEYKPRWSKSARIKWLAAQKENEAQERQKVISDDPVANKLDPCSSVSATGLRLVSSTTDRIGGRPSSRGTIQADEVDIKRGDTAVPLTAEELDAETDAESEMDTTSREPAGMEHDKSVAEDDENSDQEDNHASGTKMASPVTPTESNWEKVEPPPLVRSSSTRSEPYGNYFDHPFSSFPSSWTQMEARPSSVPSKGEPQFRSLDPSPTLNKQPKAKGSIFSALEGFALFGGMGSP